MKLLRIIFLVIIFFAIFGALYQCIGTKLDEQKYPPIGRMVDVGGYKLHMIDEGQSHNGPTVVIDSGMGCNCMTWALVYPEIAKFTRVIVTDRAGYGWSDASPLLRTSENIVKELHTMLHNANVPAPYVLVGHSFGGLNVRLFASTYPEEVVGIVLVDASHEDQIKSPGNFVPKFADSLYLEWKKYIETYFGINRFLRQRLVQYTQLKKTVQMLPLELQDAYLSSLLSSKLMQAKAGEIYNFMLSCNQLKHKGDFFDNKPLIVITAGNIKIDEKYTQEKESYRRKLQADLVTKSSHGKQLIAEKSGHMIPIEQPEIIVDAVQNMVDELRAKNKD